MASYLVTGGAGFIGSHLAEELVRRGHRVRVADSLITGKRRNLEHVDGVDFVEGDLADMEVAIRSMPIPTQDKVWERFRREQTLLSAAQRHPLIQSMDTKARNGLQTRSLSVGVIRRDGV
jgi:nucleoside-diphosphate-sugar epimerase